MIRIQTLTVSWGCLNERELHVIFLSSYFFFRIYSHYILPRKILAKCQQP